MKLKNVLTAVLLLFVAGSVGALVVKQLRRGSADESPPGDAVAANDASTNPASGEGSTSQDASQLAKTDVSKLAKTDVSQLPRTIVHYFHGRARCMTCRRIEAYTHQAVKTGFAEQLEDGRIKWRVVNYDEPENEHFVEDYQLIAPMVVLSKMEGGRETASRSLTRVWRLVGDEDTFIEYVQREVQEFLEESGT